MVKINLFSTFVLALFVMVGTTNAQSTKIWGYGTAVNPTDGEFGNPFVNSVVAGSYNATAWTALSVNDLNGAPGAAYWVRNLTGYSAGTYWSGTTPVGSATQANGIAIFDSDFLDNGGTGVFNSGTSPSFPGGHRGELISPRIDLSGFTDSALYVSFYTFYRDYDIGSLSVSISTDDGASWGTEVDWRPNIAGSPIQGRLSVLFKNATQGVTNLTQCRVKFVFEGDYYFAIVDDVTVETAPQYQIAMGNANPTSTLLVGNGTNVKIGGNRYMPLTSVDNLASTPDFREWFWGGKVTNNGHTDLLPQDSASINVRIDHVNPSSGAVTMGVYTDVMYFDSLYGGDMDGVTNIDYLTSLNFIKTYGRGDYNVTYWVTYKNSQGLFAADDTARHTFTMTHDAGTLSGPTEKHYLSKARLSGVDGRVGYSRSIFPGTVPASMEFGSVFFFPRGASDAVTIDSIDFRYQVPAGFNGAALQSLLCTVYEMDASSSAVLNDATLLTTVGITQVDLAGCGTTVPAGSYALKSITNLINPGGGAMAPLKDNAFYYIAIGHNPSAFGAPAMTATNTVRMCVDESNMYMNAAMTAVDSVINPSPLNETDGAGATTWYWTGFGAQYLPSLGIYLTTSTIVNNSTVFAEKGAELKVYPNPTTNLLNVNLTLEEASDVMYIITDMSGRVVTVLNSNNVTNDTQSIDVSALASGVYMITAKTDKSSSTERFIKQ